jgi:hypothetical protein
LRKDGGSTEQVMEDEQAVKALISVELASSASSAEMGD